MFPCHCFGRTFSNWLSCCCCCFSKKDFEAEEYEDSSDEGHDYRVFDEIIYKYRSKEKILKVRSSVRWRGLTEIEDEEAEKTVEPEDPDEESKTDHLFLIHFGIGITTYLSLLR